MTQRRSTLRTLALAAALWAVAAGSGLAQGKLELKLSHIAPATHGIQTEFLGPWARELESRTGGRVTVRILDGASPASNPTTQLAQLQSGAIDIAHGMQAANVGRFPRTEIIGMPYLTENAGVATRILWKMYPKQLKEEYAGYKVLALHAHNGGLFHTGDRKIATMQDLKGMRIRSPSIAMNKMLTFFGATALGMPPSQVAVNLRGGLIDGALFSWEAAHAFKIDEVTRHHLDARAYTQPYFFLMSQKKYQSLPAEVRTAIDEISGDALISKFGGWWDRWDQPGVEVARKRGGIITTLSAAERERWANAVTPTTERLLKDMEKLGVTNARAIHTEMKKLNKELGKVSAPR